MAASTNAIFVVLDRSGSMEAWQSKVIEGMNGFMEEFRDVEEDVLINALLFNDTSKWMVGDGAPCPLDEFPRFTRDNYVPRGLTSLYDAIATVVKAADAYAETHIDATIWLVIQTDGCDNSSTCTAAQAKEMLESRRKRGWKTQYLCTGEEGFGSMKRVVPDSVCHTLVHHPAIRSDTAIRRTGRLLSQKITSASASAPSRTKSSTASPPLGQRGE